MAHINKAVPGVDGYYPLNSPAIGSLVREDKDAPFLFRPLTIHGITFKNRVFVSPMCQYSSVNGHATDWHLVHIGGFASRGVGAICMEATAVVPGGRISPEDAGIWTDSQIEPLRRIVNFAHAQETKIGIQLAHAGRKASTLATWVQTQAGKGALHTALENENGWPDDVYAPSTIPYSDTFPSPKEMSGKDLDFVENAFIAAIERCEKVGFDFIEIHAAHGYLFHSFLSPLSNVRTDEFGGQPLENRLRYLLRVFKACRDRWAHKPLFVRISASDWAETPEQGDDGEWLQWGIEQSKILVGKLQELGVDMIDCSSGGNWHKQKIPVKPGYQVPFAEALKNAHPNAVIGAVGLIRDPHEAESYLKTGKADVISLARALIRDPHWVLSAAEELGVTVKPACQYERGWAPI